MSAMDPIIAILITAVTAVLLTLLLRSAGLSRSAIVGGLVTAVLLGATVLGRVAPDAYERYFIGGVTQRQTMRDLSTEHGAALTALRATDVSDAAIEELLARQQDERRAAAQALDTATAEHQSLRTFAVITVALTLLVAAAPRSRRPASWAECAFVGLWMLVVTCGLVGLAVVFAFDGSRVQAMALGVTFAALGTSVVPPRPATGDRTPVVLVPHAIRERLIDVAFVVWFICFVAAVAAVIAASQGGGMQARHFTTALPVAVVAGVGLRLIPLRIRHALRMMILPAILTALLLLTVDLLTASMIAPIVLALIIGGDARWFGLASGMRWQGWPWRNAWVGTMPLVDAAPMQVAMAAAFFLSGWLSEPLLACAAFGAAVSDVAQPLRPRLLAMLSEPADDPSDR